MQWHNITASTASNPRFEMSALAIHDSITSLTNIHTAHIHVVFVVTEGWRSRRKLPENVSCQLLFLLDVQIIHSALPDKRLPYVKITRY